jgi:hypothetical protein
MCMADGVRWSLGWGRSLYIADSFRQSNRFRLTCTSFRRDPVSAFERSWRPGLAQTDFVPVGAHGTLLESVAQTSLPAVGG